MLWHGPIRKLVVKVAAAGALLSLVTGCGNAMIRHAAPVKLSRLTPATGTRVAARTVTVAGSVKPQHARVLILGRRISTTATGHFSSKIKLETGTNLIDVVAGAPHARPAMTALRVVRYVLIAVPSVDGESPSTAAAAIRAAGLKPVQKGDGNPLAFLVPFSSRVCGQSPEPGARVDPGAVVTLSVAKVCL